MEKLPTNAGLESVFSVKIAYWRNRFGVCALECMKVFYLQHGFAVLTNVASTSQNAVILSIAELCTSIIPLFIS